MKRTIFGFAIFIIGFCLAGCLSGRAKRDRVKLDSISANTSRSTGETKSPVATPAANPSDTTANSQDTAKKQADGAVVRAYSPEGTLTEWRNFGEDSEVRYVILQTNRDGQKSGVIGGAHGEVKPLSTDMIDRAMTASTYELGSALRSPQVNNSSTQAFPAQSPVSITPPQNMETAKTQAPSDLPKATQTQQAKQTQPTIVFDQLPRRRG